jgi:hypothetical protein
MVAATKRLFEEAAIAQPIIIAPKSSIYEAHRKPSEPA